MPESNPYASPHAVSSSKPTSRVFTIVRNVLIYFYLLAFCSLHAAGEYISVAEAHRLGTLPVRSVVECLLLVFVAIAIWFYATNRQPRRLVKGWQALLYFTIFFALSVLRDAHAEMRTGPTVQNNVLVYLVVGVFGLIVYGPAVYMCFRVAYPPRNSSALSPQA